MEGFITFLLCFVLFIWVMKRIFPLLLTWFIKRQVKKGGANGGFTSFGGPGGFGFWSTGFGGAQNAQQHNERKKEEGKVVITEVPQTEKVIDKEIGEYVDFEE